MTAEIRHDHEIHEQALSNSQLLVWLVSGLTFVAGLLSAFRPLAEDLPSRVRRTLVPINHTNTSLIILALGLLLMYVSFGLVRRKQAAWVIAVVLMAASFGLHILFKNQYLTATLSGMALISLIITRRQFRSRLHESNLRLGLGLMLGSISFAFVYGIVGFWYLGRMDFGQTFSFWQSVSRTIKEYLLIGNSDLVPHTDFATFFQRSLAVVGFMSLAYAVFNIFRPLRYRLRVLPSDRQQARAILENYGGEADDFFKLWPQDKSYFFSSDGEAFVAYGVARGIAVCFAGPVGKPSSIKGLIGEFESFCLVNGWSAAFAQASNRFGKELKAAGFDELLIGADAVIELDKFMTSTVRNKYFRNIVNRYDKKSFSFERYLPPHSNDLLKEVRQVSTSWQSRGGRKQWRFFTGHYATNYLQQTALFVVRDANGQLMAFVNELPCFKKSEATIDLMRHRRDVPPNLMDWLFIKLITQLQTDGFKKFNLGISILGGKEAAIRPADKLLHFLFNSNQKIIAFKGLHRYKSKFEPDWEPRYLYYQGSPARLPQIGLAIVKLIRY